MTIRIAFPLIGRGGWTGGYQYLKNTLHLIAARLADRVEAHVLLSPDEAKQWGAELAGLVDGRLIVDPAVAGVGRGRSLARALATGIDTPLLRLLQKHRIDVTFENATFYGWRFPLPVIAWMPDFQHRHMPEMFGRLGRLRREAGFALQIASHRTPMVSSRTALADLERFHPSAKGRGRMVRFAIDLDVSAHLGRGEEMRAAHALPERFFYLPNQFWRHKNHATMIGALAWLKAEGRLDEIPPIVLTGQTKDPRHPTHFEDLTASVAAAGVGDHFRYLGLVPYDHVLALNASCSAMINPSLFEGWSTPIEEAKAFATPLILSDLAIHREQAPEARFFDPRSAQAAAEALIAAARAPILPRPDAAILASAQSRRLDEHAASLLAVIEAATARR